jgi:hypothetical protein
MTTTVRRHRTALDVVSITPQDKCAPSAITHAINDGSCPHRFPSEHPHTRQSPSRTRDLTRPAPDLTASGNSHGIQSP